MPDIMHLIRIKASPERVFRALTTADDIRNWWTRDADLAPHAGGSGEFRFYERKIVTEVRVDEIEPAVHVGWRTVSSRRAGSLDGTTISFDLRAEDGETVLAFAHRGFPLANEGYTRVTTGWAYYLVSLQQYVETGSGAPHPDVDFRRVIRPPAHH